ncbi:MAG: thiamine pyrophosphate-dependent enzyme [Polyangiaceae bacterium]
MFHQRGAAGIDGLLAGAAGVRAALDPQTPLVTLLGDVSAAHDLGSFAALRMARAPHAIVLVDNDGGRIFDGLPVRGVVSDAAFDALYRTPPSIDWRAAAAAFGLGFVASDSVAELDAALRGALGAPTATLIVAKTSHAASASCRKRIAEAVREAVRAEASS